MNAWVMRYQLQARGSPGQCVVAANQTRVRSGAPATPQAVLPSLPSAPSTFSSCPNTEAFISPLHALAVFLDHHI
jgi:hypothetical protein